MVKKLLIFAAPFLLFASPAFADTVSVNHPTAYAGPNGNSAVGASPLAIATCSITSSGDVSVWLIDSEVNYQGEIASGANCVAAAQSQFNQRLVEAISYNVLTDPQPYDYSFVPDTYKLIIVKNDLLDGDGNPPAVSINSVTGDFGILYATPLYTVLNEEAPVPQAPVNGVSALISDGETAFQSTTGTSLSASVGWAGDNLIKPWVGSGLAVLGGLAGWLAALAAIAAIIFFVFRALNKGLNERNNRTIVSGGSSQAPKKKKAKPSFQKGGGYQAYKLRQALKKGKYKDSKVHSAFGKNWT